MDVDEEIHIGIVTFSSLRLIYIFHFDLTPGGKEQQENHCVTRETSEGNLENAKTHWVNGEWRRQKTRKQSKKDRNHERTNVEVESGSDRRTGILNGGKGDACGLEVEIEWINNTRMEENIRKGKNNEETGKEESTNDRLVKILKRGGG